MRLTLSASETGHLVLATVHSSTCAEALQRVVGSFPAEIQSSVAAQLADCLVAVISQRLHFRENLKMRVPECEVLMATNPVKNFIRNRDFFKIASFLETGAEHGMWSLHRYRAWLDKRKDWYLPDQNPEPPEESNEPASMPATPLPALAPSSKPASVDSKPMPPAPPAATPHKSGQRIEIEPTESEFGKILKRPGES